MSTASPLARPLCRPLARSLSGPTIGFHSDPDANDYLVRVAAAAGVPLSSNFIAAAGELIVGLKADGNWEPLGTLGVFAGPPNLAGALVPLRGTLVNNGFTEAKYHPINGLGSPTNNVDGMYLETGANNSDYPQNSRSMFFGSSSGTSFYAMIGMGGTSVVGGSEILQDGTRYFISLNGTTFVLTGAPAVGFTGIARNNATTIEHNSTGAAGIGTKSQTSQAPTAGDILFFARGDTNYCRSIIQYMGEGEYVNLAQVKTRMLTYIASLT